MALLELSLSQIDYHPAGGCRFWIPSKAAVARLMLVPPENLPPIVVFHEKTAEGEDRYWLGDGLLRMEAAFQKKRFTLWADVRPGGYRDALLYAARANVRHGLPRSMADKRDVVLRLLSDPNWSQQSNVWIAEQCKVSHTYVGKLRKRLGKPLGPRLGRDGKVRKLPKDKASESPPCSRDVALAELVTAKRQLSEAIRDVERAKRTNERLRTWKSLKSLRAAKREIELWIQDLESRPPEPPKPDPNDLSPEAQLQAQIYELNRMAPRAVIAFGQKMMTHDLADLARRADSQPATKRAGRESRDEGRVVSERDNQPATKRAGEAGPQALAEAVGLVALGATLPGNQPATKRADSQPATKRGDAEDPPNGASPISNLRSPIPTLDFQPATKRSGPRDP